MQDEKTTIQAEQLPPKPKISDLIKLPVYILSFIFLGIIFGYLAFKVLSFGRTVEVPDMYGKSMVEAKELLTKNRLSLEIEGEDYDAIIPAGYILRQDISAGDKVKEQTNIKVILSRGTRIKSVPMLVNETLSKAETLLSQKGVKITKKIMVHSDVIEKGRIVAQKPRPDEEASDQIIVLVSLGHYDIFYYCPDFKGMSVEYVEELAEKLNLVTAIKGSGNYIMGQKPEPGNRIKAGDTIYLQTE
ncbi:MAG: PASTA domain-containing protein [Nitrospirota bacterium]